MAKISCILCLARKGKRECLINKHALICSQCCASIRNFLCAGCRYYLQAESFALEKEKEKETKAQQPFIIDLNPEVEKEVDQALALVERGKIVAGERIILELLRGYPSNHMVQFAMGVIHLIKRQYEKALLFFTRAVEIYPEFIEAWYNKGVAHRGMFEIEEMIAAFQEVVKLGDPREKTVREAKNNLRDLQKHFLKTDGFTIDEYLENKRKFDEAFEHMSKHQWQKALDGFREVLKQNPDHTQSYGNIGICYGMLGNREQALAALDKALELDPNYNPAKMNRDNILRLKDGERLEPEMFKTIEFYRDSYLRKSPK